MEELVQNIDLNKAENEILFHPRYADEAKRVLAAFNKTSHKDHILLFSSGTTSELKGYALSREALKINAHAVNAHFNLYPSDVWGLSLPTYHVGGLSVLIRAQLLGNKVVDLRNWEPLSWLATVTKEKVTITTIVPTQLYDLVKHNLSSPPDLKYLIVGGDFLSHELELRALKLGWPVIRTYGMSEVCSQLASAKSSASHEMEILPIHQAKISGDERLLVKSQSLFTLEFKITSHVSFKHLFEFCDEEGFYPTQDRARIVGSVLYPEGRLDDQIKVSGHMVNFNIVKNDFYKYLLDNDLYGKAELILESDERKGQKINLLAILGETEKFNWDNLRQLLNPIRIDEIKYVNSLERTDLGKLKKKQGPIP